MPIPARGDCHFRVRRLQSPRAALTEITTHLIFFRYFCQNFPVVLCVLLLFLYLCSAKGSKSYRMTLRELNRGQSATILKVGGEGALRQHFLDMGMIPGAQVTLQKRSRSMTNNQTYQPSRMTRPLRSATNWSIQASARKAVTTIKTHFTPFHRQKRVRSPLRSSAIRTAERRPYLIS